MKNFALGALSIVVLLSIAGAAFYWGAQKAPPTTNQPNTVTLPQAKETNILPPNSLAPTPQSNQVPNNQPSAQENLKQQIMAVLDTKNFAAIQGYMAETVFVRLEASGCCGPLDPFAAANQLSYLDTATGWDFNPSNPIIQNLAIASPDYYGAGWFVGVADNEFICSFKFNSNNKIEAYNLGATYKLLIP